jgi:predicted metal-dependent hydrolase
MPVKQFHIDGLGEIKVFKRRHTKRISLKVVSNNKIYVTQPTWLPYANGVQFAISHRSWIDEQCKTQPGFLPQANSIIGKNHTLKYQPHCALKSKVTPDEVTIFVPAHLHIHSPEVLEVTRKAIIKALKAEAEIILRQRLNEYADKFGLSYKDARFKSMRTRWGSCTSNHDITLNVSLLLLPYRLIDYVILHELMHTKYLNHSVDFWGQLESVLPDYKPRRKELKNVQHSIMSLH